MNEYTQYLRDIGYDIVEYKVHPFKEEDYTTKERKFEVWDDTIDGYMARYRCSRCQTIHIERVSNGASGLCSFCDEVDYWDMIAIQIDGRFYAYDRAVESLTGKGLIRIETEYVKVLKDNAEARFEKLNGES